MEVLSTRTYADLLIRTRRSKLYLLPPAISASSSLFVWPVNGPPSVETYRLGGRLTGICQVPLCWPEPVCSVSGYSSMSLVSTPSGHGHTPVACVQNTSRLSAAVLTWDSAIVGLSGSVRVNLRCGQPWWSAITDLASSSRSQVHVSLPWYWPPDLGATVRQRPLVCPHGYWDRYSVGYLASSEPHGLHCQTRLRPAC